MLTPESIQGLSKPIEDVYVQCVDELLLNIASHLKGGSALASLDWEVTKLAELGQLRRENIEIIKAFTGDVPALLDGTFGNAIMIALEGVEPELAAAAAAGLFTGVYTAPMASERIINILQNYSRQALDQLNLVNTVMLNSSLKQYRKAIADTLAYEKQLEKAQVILNKAAGETSLGISSRIEALRHAVQKLNDVGLTGFKDAAGRNWSVEAYVNMDIRTTVHNVAVQSVFSRNDEYGNTLISVSSHSGSRPLCYPYQGKVYSLDGTDGDVEDLHGQLLHYEPLESTSYGEPAGLFGINCGHMPSVFIPGLSIIRGEAQDKDANDKAYKLSQQQRRLEREVRYAKREAALFNATGDKESFDKAATKVQLKQANLNKFATTTGRTLRVDRTQVIGYDRRVAGKVMSANKASAESERSIFGRRKPTSANPATAKKTPRFSNSAKRRFTTKPTQPDLPSKYADILCSRYDSGTRAAKKIYKKYIPDGGAVSISDLSGTAHYIPNSNSIEMSYARDLVNLRGPGTTWFHEHGHYLDAALGSPSRRASFRQALLDDYQAYRDSIKNTWGITNETLINDLIEDELCGPDIKHKANGISDLIHACSGGVCRGAYGHDIDYWTKDSRNIGREAFAHMFDAQFEPEKDILFKQFFPTAYKEFLDVLASEGATI